MSYEAKTKSAPLQAGWLDTVEPQARRDEAARLLAIFAEVTGFVPRLWGGSMVGFGRYEYRYDSGQAGESFATGFSPRKAAISIYIMPGYADHGAILQRLGPHRLGKSCLYVKRLAALNEVALREVIGAGLEDLRKRWLVFPV